MEAGVDATAYGMATQMPPPGEVCCTVEIVDWHAIEPKRPPADRVLRRRYPELEDMLMEPFEGQD